MSVLERTFTHGITGYYSHRCRCETCKTAGAQYQARYRLLHPRFPAVVEELAPRHLSVKPLELLLMQRGLTFTTLGGISGGTINAWRHRGLPLYSADAIACRLGHHPFEIWGADWWEL